MTLMSMTGFARAAGAGLGYRWTWELRSVNGKGLDIRLRLPPGVDALEQPVRERIGARLQRGNLQVSLSLQKEESATQLRVNEPLLEQVLALLTRIGGRIDAAPASLDGILAIRGILETVDAEDDPDKAAELLRLLTADFDRALEDLVQARAGEGAAIGAVLRTRLVEIDRLRQAAEDSPARTPEAIRRRLKDQVAALLDASINLDADRLHQEAALLATRADIREELDRLAAHVVAAESLLSQGGAVGRKLDFLAQEFNRETNTLCSKANDRSLTAIGLDMKSTVDQLREQIQNLE
ncbi:YicC family protein [Mesorhizobium sp. BR1-1-16]|uniref:YicC/YloC family endoribonuclease n=1 Tax=Mesorhizobium sp. BR1-1-16 TaxID=2876653 RepID=UPI001CC9F215|nr:YicC/YloC family endoribonuclease [Mesorhizobium sp. BR1-1-16]MBZ9935133.1 YicC family protein [Mesorhizobium sp. BR1-1-16]